MKYTTVFISIIYQFVICNSFDCSSKVSTDTNERLKENILCLYDTTTRPSESPATVEVNFLLKSFDFLERTNSLNAQFYIEIKWNDDRLKWNPSEYDNIDKMFASISNIWVPDISIYNSETLEGMNSCMETDCLILSTGNVSCTSPCDHTATCPNTDYTDWPFDIQQCKFEYLLRTQSTKQLMFKNHSVLVDTETGWISNKWNLLATYSQAGKRLYIFDGYEKSSPYIKLFLTIERQNEGYIRQIIIPAIILCGVNMLLLMQNPNDPERIVILSINMFSYGVFIDQLRWMIPNNGDLTPTVFTLFVDLQLITVALMFETVFLKKFVKESKTPNKWIVDLITQINSCEIGRLIIGSTCNIKEPSGSSSKEGSTDEIAPKSLKYNMICRIMFGCLLDRFLIIILLLNYSLMFKELIPNGREVQ